MTKLDKIIIKGARQHNLKNLDLEIPKNTLTVFTGLSGSGKSSLAFDTIYAEGQRRYVESLSSYARQFLGIMDKPDVDSIIGLSPAISIDQKSTSHNPRSTVGTITEIYDYLRLLFARIGHPHCPNCSREIYQQSPQQIVESILKNLQDELKKHDKRNVRLLIFSPVIRGRKGEFSELFKNLKMKGFTRVRIDGHLYELSEDIILIKTNRHTIDVVVDRLVINKPDVRNSVKILELKRRLTEDIESATLLSGGLVIISQVKDASFTFPDKPKNMNDNLYSEKFACPWCNISLSEIEPRIFSFNSPHGACSKCTGIGTLLKVDPQLILNNNLSITEGGIKPFSKLILSDTWFGRIVLTVARKIGINPSSPLKFATPPQLNLLLNGTGNTLYEVTGQNRQDKTVTIVETFAGIIPELERRYSETESDFVRSVIGKYLRSDPCPLCNGKRLKKEALNITIGGKSIVDITEMSIANSLQWVNNLIPFLSTREITISTLINKELQTRLSFLLSVGLEYLTLHRNAQSLSGGEAQRIRLASQIGSGLSGVLYILDEPSIGLHPKDNGKLIKTLKSLRDLGNTVIVVEHDREMMEHADYIFDFGPKAGLHGGRIVAQGTVNNIKNNPESLTGRYLSYKKNIQVFAKKREFSNGTSLVLVGCRENNLKNITARFPLNSLICVSGVSGSGKSTLVVDTLYQVLAHFGNPYHHEKIGAYSKIEGLQNVKRVILIDQSPIGRTPRSNPATYSGAFTYIRQLFAQTQDARSRGYQPGRFSFNVKGGRCESCEGEGQLRIEMQFLPDVYVTCDVCSGSRYNSETLEIDFKDKNIADCLKMTVEDALKFFANIPPILNKFATLYDVGLSYIKLGQPAPQLSGGEAQRVKLATELSKRGSSDTVYILDEPTTGLHFADLEKLMYVLRKLVDMGNTVIVIEHNLDVLKNSDWIIDLGPEGGENGGNIICEGTPIEVSHHKNSYTGQHLKHCL